MPVVTSESGQEQKLFAVYSRGQFEFYFQHYKPPFADPGSKMELLRKFEAIDGVTIGTEGLQGRPNIFLKALRTKDNLDKLLSVFDSMIHELRKTSKDASR